MGPPTNDIIEELKTELVLEYIYIEIHNVT